jgi:hypothetical protein
MKKTSLLALLLLLSTFSFAQKEEDTIDIYISKVTFTETKATLTSFMVFLADKDAYVTNLIQLIGNPVENSSGRLLWKNISVDGLGQVPQVKLFDGLFTHDSLNKSACFVPFTDAEDKQRKLASLQSNQIRQMRIQFVDNNGDCIIHTDEQAALSKKFLSGALKKG